MKNQNYIDWWKKNKENGLDELEKQYNNLFIKTKRIPSIYQPILYRYSKHSELKHWDKDIFKYSRNKIEEIENNLGKDKMRETLLSNMHLFTDAYQKILDIEERIILMNRFKGHEGLKAKNFTLNIYNDLLNTSFSNILELFISFHSVMENKKLAQNSLTPKIECLSSKKRDYKQITDLANSDIRNAISHGGTNVEDTKIIFSYKTRGKYINKETTVYEFKDSLFRLFDGVSAVLLSWIEYFCMINLSYNELVNNESVHEEAILFYERLSLSTLLTTCDRVWVQNIRKKNTSRKQINIEFSGVDLDVQSRLYFGLRTANKIFQTKKISSEDSVMISFKSFKTPVSFFIVDYQLANNLKLGIINIEEAANDILQSGKALLFPINKEKRNLYEDQFRYYSDIETRDYLVTEIEDISIENQKRFKAVAYLKRAKRRNHVRKAVEEIIRTLKNKKNYGFPSHQVKHGEMSADIIYLVLYKTEVRRTEDRSLFPNNSNFIAQIQYDIDKKFPISNNFTDKYLKKRRLKSIEYNWNPNF